jgi:hypothetical protein
MEDQPINKKAEKQKRYRQRVKAQTEAWRTESRLISNIPKAVRAAADAGDEVAREVLADSDTQILKNLEVRFYNKTKRGTRRKTAKTKI